MSTNNKNKNNNSSNSDNDNDDYHEFMPYLQKEIDCYKNAFVHVETITGRGGKTVTQTIPFQRKVLPKETVYREYMAKITNPTTNKFYFERDSNGNEVHQQDGKNACYVIKSITRLRRADGSEWLYSQGQIQGFSSLGSLITTHCNSPETWEKTTFLVEREFDLKTKTVKEITKGEKSKLTVYELPFSAENVDKLHSMAVGINGNTLTGDRHYELSLNIKDERSGGQVREIRWSNDAKSLELFKNKGFDYLWNEEHIPEPYKAEQRARSEGLLGKENIIEVQKTEKDNKNYRGYTL